MTKGEGLRRGEETIGFVIDELFKDIKKGEGKNEGVMDMFED